MKQSKSEPIKTVLVITVGMLIVYLITKWQWAIYISVILGVLGLLSSFLAKKIDFLWMKIAWVFGLIIPNVLLSVIFFFLLTPIALASRLFGEKNQLTLKNTTKSLFKDSRKDYDKTSFENPW